MGFESDRGFSDFFWPEFPLFFFRLMDGAKQASYGFLEVLLEIDGFENFEKLRKLRNELILSQKNS